MSHAALERIKAMDQKFVRTDLPKIDVGDVVKLKIKVKEAEKMRIHTFEGTVIKKTGRGMKSTFTVRKISFGEGVERVFPFNSPVIESMEIISKGVVKRARLYYLRDRVGKKTRVKRELQPVTASVAA